MRGLKGKRRRKLITVMILAASGAPRRGPGCVVDAQVPAALRPLRANLAGTFETPPLVGRFSYWAGATLDVLFDGINAAIIQARLSRAANARHPRLSSRRIILLRQRRIEQRKRGAESHPLRRRRQAAARCTSPGRKTTPSAITEENLHGPASIMAAAALLFFAGPATLLAQPAGCRYPDYIVADHAAPAAPGCRPMSPSRATVIVYGRRAPASAGARR